jgi:hypothetical protein
MNYFTWKRERSCMGQMIKAHQRSPVFKSFSTTKASKQGRLRTIFFLWHSNFYKGSSELGFGLIASLSAPEPHQLFVSGLHIHFTINTLFFFLHKQIMLSLWDWLSTVSFLSCRDGQVKESHSTQPVTQSSPKWHQETQEASPHLHERGTFPFFLANLLRLFFAP